MTSQNEELAAPKVVDRSVFQVQLDAGTTMSNPARRGKYASEANASMTVAKCAALNMVKCLSNDRCISVVAAGTHEALHVMRFDRQIAIRFEQNGIARMDGI